MEGLFIGGLIALGLLIYLGLALAVQKRKAAAVGGELADVSTLLGTYIDAVTALVFLKDDQFRYVFVNEAFREFLGLSDDEIIGRHDDEIVDPGLAVLCTGLDQAALDKGALLTDTFSWEGKVYQTTKFPVLLPGGGCGVGSYIIDVSRETEQEELNNRVHKHIRLMMAMQSRAFASTEQQLDYALNRIVEMTGSRYGYIFLYDEQTQQLIPKCWSRNVVAACNVQDVPELYQLDETGIWGEVIRQRQPLVINDFEAEHPLKRGSPHGHVRFTRFMSVPVIIDDRLVATVGLGNKESDYDRTDVYELIVLMGGVWNAVRRREAAQQLADERNKYYQTLLSISDGVIVIDLDRRVEFINIAGSQIIDQSLEQVLGQPYQKIISLRPVRPQKGSLDVIEEVFRTYQTQKPDGEIMLSGTDGVPRYLEVSASPITQATGSFAGVVFVFRDVTEGRERLKKIEHLSYHDDLTGLHNRHYFQEQLLTYDRKSSLPLSIIMGDVNGLKLINDIFGHSTGDRMLQKVAMVMKSICRADDIVARWGGDEFIVLLPNTSREDAERVAERIKEEVARQQVRSIGCSISLGICTKDKAGDSIRSALANAEAKMYSVKILERGESQGRRLQAILDMLYLHDGQQQQHAAFVSDTCVQLGEVLNLPQSDISRLERAGYLHDIGKVVLGPELIERGYPVSEQEEEELQRHPAVGYRILNHFEETMELAEIVLAHHERWDGSGYPQGLKGEAIPFLARIVAVVSHYSRLLNDQDRLAEEGNQASVLEIVRQAGHKFDPQVAAAFVSLLDSNQASDNRAR